MCNVNGICNRISTYILFKKKFILKRNEEKEKEKKRRRKKEKKRLTKEKIDIEWHKNIFRKRGH